MSVKEKYKYVTNNKEETQCIGLTQESGVYQGVIYKYGQVSIPDPEEMKSKSDLPLSFHYDIVDNNSLPKEYFNKEIFDKGLIYSNQKYMRTIVYPSEGIQASYNSATENELVLDIGNVCSWPIRIIDAVKNDQHFPLKQEIDFILNINSDFKAGDNSFR